ETVVDVAFLDFTTKAIEEQATLLLPDDLITPSSRGMSALVDKPLLIELPERDYCELIIKQRLMEIKIGLAYQEAYPAVEKGMQELISSQIDMLTATLRNCLYRDLPDRNPVFNKGYLNQTVSRIRKSLLDRIG